MWPPGLGALGLRALAHLGGGRPGTVGVSDVRGGGRCGPGGPTGESAIEGRMAPTGSPCSAPVTWRCGHFRVGVDGGGQWAAGVGEAGLEVCA